MRRAQGLYMEALCDEFAGKNAEAERKLSESISLNNENLLALHFQKFGFLS